MDMDSTKRGWQLTPEEADELPPAPNQQEMHRAGQHSERQLWKAVGSVSPAENRRFAGPLGWRLYWKPPAYTFGAGGPAWLLIIGQLWLPELDAALGSHLGGYLGLTRLGLILVGAVLLYIAAPLYKPADWTPAQQKEMDEDHDYFQRKREP